LEKGKNPPFGLFAPPIHFDQIIILEKSILTQSFWLGVMDKKKCNFEKTYVNLITKNLAMNKN